VKITITSEFPAFVTAPTDPRASFGPMLLEGIHSAVDPMLEDARNQTEYASIREGYYSEDTVTANGVAVDYGNRARNFIWREENTSPHWPPFFKGSSLDVWSHAHGIPTFLVAREIARVGTTGNHIFRNAQQLHRPRIDQAVQNAAYAWVLSSLSGGTR
jgi:hypothetical protein